MYSKKNAKSKTAPISLRANALWNSLGCLFYLGCQWLTTVLVVTLSSDYENSGILAFAMSVGIIFASIALYKVRTFQVSDTKDVYSSSDYVSFRIVTIAIGFAICVGYLTVVNASSSLFLASVLYTLFKADESFSDVIYGIYQKHERMDYIGKSQLLRGWISLVAFCLPLLIGGSLYTAIICMAVACFGVTVFFDLPHARLFSRLRLSFSQKNTTHLLKILFLAMVASLCANAIVSLVRQYFGLVSGEEALGVYAAVATPAVLVQVATSYLYMPLINSMALDYNKGGMSALKARFIKTFIIILICVSLLILVLSIIGTPLLTFVYGSSIGTATYLFPYVLVGTGCVGILMFANDVLIVIREMKWILVCNLTSLVVALGSAVLLIPIYDMNGINYSVIIGSLVGIILCVIGIKRGRQTSENSEHAASVKHPASSEN